jgi:hypothetical protein
MSSLVLFRRLARRGEVIDLTGRRLDAVVVRHVRFVGGPAKAEEAEPHQQKIFWPKVAKVQALPRSAPEYSRVENFLQSSS